MNANVIIPTKSNVVDLYQLLVDLHKDPKVGEIIVIADGEETYNRLLIEAPVKVTLLKVPLSIGLHTMWNLGMEHVKGRNQHLAIINDDVSLSPGAIGKMCELLDSLPAIGLVTPTDNQSVEDGFIPSTSFAGYCMVLASDLVDEWRFDENMKWWYGDVDVVLWVNKTKKRLTGISGYASATNNRSYTITNDPPPNFHQAIENDARIFHSKWG